MSKNAVAHGKRDLVSTVVLEFLAAECCPAFVEGHNRVAALDLDYDSI